ncbi:MAG: hypothetical protein RR334_01085 [Clostridia bacterium]
MTITIGYFIEFIEYIIDTELNTNLQKYKDTLGLIQLSNIALKDTIFDIFSVFVGGALSSFVISLRILKSKKVPLSIIISSKENYSRLEKIKDKEIELIYTDEPYDKTKTRFNE